MLEPVSMTHPHPLTDPSVVCRLVTSGCSTCACMLRVCWTSSRSRRGELVRGSRMGR